MRAHSIAAIAKFLQSGRNVAGERLAHCGLDFSKNFWPLGILLFRVAALDVAAGTACFASGNRADS
jgi:hypothetical protein